MAISFTSLSEFQLRDMARKHDNGEDLLTYDRSSSFCDGWWFRFGFRIVFSKVVYSEHNFPNSQLLLTIYPATAFIPLSEKPLK